MELLIKSKKYGERIVLIDDEDYDKIKGHVWRLLHQKDGDTEYVQTNIIKKHPTKTMRMHIMIMGRKEGMVIDHIDGNGLNNQKANLRFCTQGRNTQNSRMQKSNTTGYKGVYFQKKKLNRPYWSYLWVNKKRITGGYFKTAQEAAAKYNELAIKHHGEFARLNKI